MTRQARLRLIATAGIAPAVAVALSVSAAASQQIEGLAFTPYGMADGLSHGSVEALIQDTAGFIWIGTHDGLNRFDGTSFRAYLSRSDDPTSLSDDYIMGLALADEGRIWVGTERGGLNRFDPLTGRAERFPMADLGPWMMDASSDAGGDRAGRTVHWIAPLESTVLLGTDLGLVRFDPVTLEYALIPGGERAEPLCVSPGGVAFAGFPDGRVARVTVDGIVEASVHRLPTRIHWLSCDEDGSVYAGTYDGELHRINSTAGSAELLTRVLSDLGDPVSIRDVLRTDSTTIWIATGQGPRVLDERTGELLSVAPAVPERSIPGSDIWRLLIDATGVFWVGTWNGLATLHPLSATMDRVFRQAGGRPGLRGDGVIAIETSPDGSSWVGLMAGGVQTIVPFSDRSWEVVDSFQQYARSDVFGLAAGEQGLWVAAYTDGLLRQTSPTRLSAVPISASDGEVIRARVAVYSVFVDHAGEVWAGTVPVGLVRYDSATDEFRPFLEPSRRTELGSDWIWPIDEDDSGRLWVGAFNGGIASIDRDRERIRLYPAGPGGLNDGRILTLFVDSRQDVWVGTEGGGLNHFDTDSQTFTLYTVENGLPHDNVEGIVEDAFGHLWITTNNGLARFDRETEEFVIFGESTGLAGSRFYANAAHRGPDDRLYFGGPDGLTIVDPAAIESRGHSPHVALSGFRIQGRETPLARVFSEGGLDLEPDENFFAFEFALMDFADVTQNRYRYRLDPLDVSWVDAGSVPLANYTSVPAGRYTFRVAARNGEGVWNETALEVPLRVQEPYYETLLFRSSAVLVFLSMITGIYWYRLQQLRERQKLRVRVFKERQQRQGLEMRMLKETQEHQDMRLRLAGELHDDIGANLTAIAKKADWLLREVGPDEAASEKARAAGRLARKTMKRVRETVWFVREEYDTLPRLVQKMHDTADDLLPGQVVYDFPEIDVPARGISPEYRENVYCLFKEALNNLVKHSEATRVDVELGLEDGRLLLRIADDGVGFDRDSGRLGDGLDLMEKRAKQIGGSLVISSASGTGTTVELEAPIPQIEDATTSEGG